jgi:diguanylate cyclase (GGDEF)-like protein
MTILATHFKPNDEIGRQSALDRLHVLDTPKEKEFDKITDLVTTVLKVPVAAVTLIDRDRQWFKSIQGLDVSETVREVAFCDHTIRTTRCLNIADATRDARFLDNALVTGPPHIRSYLGAPIITPDGYGVGALCAIDYRPRSFSEEQEKVLGSFADLVMNELELRQVAAFDELTGLATRRTFVKEIEIALGRPEDAMLLFLDLDHFKAVNDTFGHAAGDDVLRKAAAALLDICTDTAIAGRLGGEELALILPGGDEATALQFAETVRCRIAEIHLDTYPDLTVSTSIGIAMRRACKDGHSWMEAADSALYEAKQDGRNCVRVARPALTVS